MAWLSTIFESLPKALIFGGLLFWIVVTNPGVGARVVGVALIGLLAAIVLGRVFDRFGLPSWVFSVVLIAVVVGTWLATWTAVFNS